MKPAVQTMNSFLRPTRVASPAERRGHDRGGDDIGGQHPVDLILRRRQRALHIGQGDIGDRRVERLHDRRHHHADRQHASAPAARSARRPAAPFTGRRPRRRRRRAGHDRPAKAPSRLFSVRARPVSIETLALMPARRPVVSSSGSKQKRSGTRCTTLTQLPLAFCGGRIANCAPVPGAIEQTLPLPDAVRERRRSSPSPARPVVDVGEVRFLRIGVDPQAPGRRRWRTPAAPAATTRPSSICVTCVATPAIGARTSVLARLRSASSTCALAWI